MDNTVATRLGDVSKYLYNPAAIQRAAVALIPAMTNGEIEFVDPSNPVVMCIENASINTAAWMIQNAALTRKQYPAAAQTIEDLYPHMSDKDYIDRFAVPTIGTFVFFFGMDEILSKLVADASNSGVRKVIIPRNTYVTVNDTVFSLQYPIEIRQMAHGGLQIVYDVDELSPLQTLSTNLIEWKIITASDGTELLAFSVEMTQFKINSQTGTVTNSTGFVLNIKTEDQFFFGRVFQKNNDGSYTELLTTHTEEIYDPATPTAVFTVLDGQVRVKIPQIYLTTGMVTGTLRIDIYETKGVLSMNMVAYRPEQYVIKYEAYNAAEKNEYVAPLTTLRINSMMSNSVINAGQDSLTFEQLRKRVISNAIGSPDLPITNTQIEASLEREGYTVVKNIDNITNRAFLAARPMPDPQASELITAAAAGISTLSTSVEDAILIDTVVDNGDVVTIKPETLYKSVNGVIELVPDSEVAALNAMAPDQKAIAVNNANYMYTPFYYVMDSSGNEFNLRPYHLDTPIVDSKSFVGENDTTLLQVGTDQYQIMRSDGGYVVEIQTKSSDEWKALNDDEVFVQMAFIPTGDVDRAYVQGQLMGKTDTGERIYHFPINTTWKIGADNELQVSSFLMYNDTPRNVDMPLLRDFDVMYSTNTPRGPQWVMSDIDAKLGYFLLPDDAYAITQESFSIRFGYFLEYLWARARTIVGEANYEKYAIDVPATYSQDVYLTDPATGAAFTVNSDGELVYTILHHKDDPVLDAEGNQVYKFRVGDIKLDGYGNPVIIKSRDLVRQMDLFLIEGSYYLATNQVTADYRDYLRTTVVNWLTEDLPVMGDNLLEETSLFYYPVTSVGLIKVLFSNGLETYLDAGQTFRCTLYVNSSVYNNYDLRATLTTNTIKTISDQLEQRVVSMSNITDALRTTYKDDVISIELSGLGGNKNLNVVTIIDDAQRLSLRKLLITRNDETLGLEEGVTVDFVLHERASLT